MISSFSTRQDSILINGINLSAILKESENPKADVVLVHGFTGSKEDFSSLSDLLAEMKFRVLIFDNRGQHESSYATSPLDYSMESLASDVIELVQRYGMQSPHLFGHSLGGLIAQKAATLHPSLWSSLTLFCSGPEGKPDWFDEPQFHALSNETKLAIWQEVLEPQHIDNPKRDLLKRRWLASDANSTLALHTHLREFKSLIPEIANHRLPTHVVYGELDDVWPLEEQNEMARKLNAELSVLDDCGHCPNEENPQLTAEVLAKFWNKFI